MAEQPKQKATPLSFKIIPAWVIVWPQQQRSWKEPGPVLGWKSTHLHRNTIVCAGVLGNNKSVAEYRQILSQLRVRVLEEQSNHHQHQNQNQKGCCCSCLFRTLDIVAYWDPQKNTVQNNNKDPKDDYKLPRIDNRRGYPWWSDETVGKNQGGDRPKQLMYFNDHSSSDLDGDGVRQRHQYAHLASEYQQDEWSHLLQQINAASDILEIVKNGRFISRVKEDALLSYETTTSSVPIQEVINSKDERPQDGWRKIQRFLFRQSLTILHLDQLCCTRSRKETGWGLLACLSPIRCLQQAKIYTDSKKTTTSICSHCAKLETMLPSREKNAKREIASATIMMTTFLDMLGGILIGSALLALPPTILITYYFQGKQALSLFLQQNISWLESFPAGFKLNVPLTRNMGHEIRSLVAMHQLAFSATLGNVEFVRFLLVPFFGVASILCGGTTLCALTLDLWRLEMLHLTILAACFRALYRAELYLLSALWRLFRGKKQNVLRHRTDSMQYDAMQLLVGTICFCICIFLFTTILVYYTCFACWNLGVHLPVLWLWLMYVGNRAMPWGSLWWRLQYPEWFSKSVYLEDLNGDDDDVFVTQLVSVPESAGSIIGKALSPHLKRLMAWLVPFGSEIVVPRASNLSPSTLPLVTFLEEFTVDGGGKKKVH